MEEWHRNGIHIDCDPDECESAGKVARYHSHDFDGPLPDCCDED